MVVRRQIKSARFTKGRFLSKSKKLQTLQSLQKEREIFLRVVRLIMIANLLIRKRKVSSRAGGKSFFTCNRMWKSKALYL